MFRKIRGISASTLATDYVVGAHEFFDRVVELCARLDEADDVRVPRKEACAVLWAVIVAGTEASALSEEDRTKTLPLVLQTYLQYWEKHCHETLEPQARCERYLRCRDPDSHLRTANAITDSLFQELEISDPTRSAYSKLFSALFAHRILSDVQYFNGVKANFTIE